MRGTVPAKLSPDAEFYYDIVDIQVEQTLFRVPSYPLTDSTYFRELFNHPSKKKQDPPVYVLDDVTAAEFRDLLCVVLRDTPNPKGAVMPPTPRSWISVMRLAVMWEFDEVFQRVSRDIRALDDCVTRLAIALEYHLERVLPLALEEVFRREAPLQPHEYQLLGLEFASKVVAYRELCRETPKPYLKYDAAFEEIFGREFTCRVRHASRHQC